jgi:putative transposase
MGRTNRQLPDGCSFHITLRCNSRAFLIAPRVRGDLLANHLHLQQQQQGRDLPRITQWIGHFCEARYFSTPIEPEDTRRVLATLRTIHANPKTAGVREGFHDPYSNYGHHGGLAGDGLSEWHPGFLPLAATLEGCAKR